MKSIRYMRTYLPDVDLCAPHSLDEALALLSREPGTWKLFAGGTDLMVLMEAGMLPHARYLSLWHLRELRGIDVTRDSVALGALTTYSDVLRHPTLTAEFPLIWKAAAETGSVATQNRGTIGGNIANASPAADTPPALLVYDAQLEIVSSRGTRLVPYSAFHTGYKKMDLAADEIIVRVRLPRGRVGWREEYRKVGTRRAQAISKVCFAAAADVNREVVQDLRIAFGSVAPTVVRCSGVEAVLRGRRLDADAIREAVRELPREIAPIDDLRSTASYRLRVAGNLLREFLAHSVER
jgi:CO/xanthine dehydrogenase FAD-binding subunit